MLSDMKKRKTSPPTTAMIRLPSGVVRALRRRAVIDGVTLGEAARQLILEKDLGPRHGVLEHLAWLHERLTKDQQELESVMMLGARDSGTVQAAIDALGSLQDELARSDDDDEDMRLYYQQGGF
jgi:hypothetical protein